MARWKHLTLFGLLLVFTLVAAACASSKEPPSSSTSTKNEESEKSTENSSSETNEATGLPLEVMDFGFSTYESAGEQQLAFAVIVRNPNETLVPDVQEIIVNFFDEDGTLLNGGDQYFANVVLPGSTSVVGWEFVDVDPEHVPVRMEVNVGEALGYFEMPNAVGDELLVDDIEVSSFGGATKAIATVTSTFEDDLEDVEIGMVRYNEQDEIVGYSFEVLNRLPGNGQAQTEVLMQVPPSAFERVEAWATLRG